MKGEDLIVTLDVDWAPDFVIDHVAGLLRAHGVKATWFITHDSPAVRALQQDANFELGLHPNYLPGSSQGATTEEVLKFLFAIAPGAVSVRSHAVVQSGPLLNHYVKHTPLRIDSTIFLSEMPHIRPVKHLLPDGFLWRVPFFWADDFELCKQPPQWNFESYPAVPGLKVMMFHPIHIFLNSPDLAFYADFKRRCPNVNALGAQEAAGFACTDRKGAGNFFLDLMKHLSGKRSLLLRETADL